MSARRPKHRLTEVNFRTHEAFEAKMLTAVKLVRYAETHMGPIAVAKGGKGAKKRKHE